jgi:hypothetical protein
VTAPAGLVAALREIVGDERCLFGPDELLPWEPAQAGCP